MAASKRSILVLALLGAGLHGCRASGTTQFTRPTQDDAGTGVIVEAGTVTPDSGVPEATPHALLAVEPPHGPFSGGTLVLLRGNGFSSSARVWFGDIEVEAKQVVAIDSHRIQVTAPPGAAGLADVVVQNGDDASTRVFLRGGYAYDAFYAEPASGPTSGGTLITLFGQQTQWDENTEVSIDRNPCEIVERRSPTELVCRAPAGSAGAKPIRVTTGDGSPTDVLDAFSYGNSDNGFRGGLSGDTLRAELKVLVLDGVLGEAIGNAHVIVGTDEPLVATTDTSGVALLVDEGLGPKQTVTVAKHCFQPVTFVDVPVDTLTIYLDPVISASCFSGELEPPGGTPGRGATIAGELVWPETEEFRRGTWDNVPTPKSNESKIAFVFDLASRPTAGFRLQDAMTHVTPEAVGDTGVRFNVYGAPGRTTLYALAGLQDQTSGAFTAYAMGLVRGVAAVAGQVARDVFILIDVPLDHAIRLEIEPPRATPRGPDRLRANVAIRVGSEGYLLLPFGESEALLGGAQSFSLVGAPPLIGSLLGTSYVATARAVTGDIEALPVSVLGLLGTTSIDEPLRLTGFVEVPSLDEPARNGTWNGRDLAWSYAAGGQAPDLTVIDVASGGGLYNWRIVAPGNARVVQLPDLGAVDASIRWPSGQQNFLIARAKVPEFTYGTLRYRDLGERGWSAYSMDTFLANY